MSKLKLSPERFWMMVALVLAIALFVGGRSLPVVDAREKGSTSLYEDLKVFTDVLAIVRRDYVKEVDTKRLVEGAIKGMLATLDPHSGYLDPDFYQDLQVQTKGEFGGLGIEITIKDGLLVVVAPMEGSPAEKVGIKAGDAIVKIEGRYTKEYSLVDAVKKLRGPKGSPIAISVMRKGSPDLLDFTIVRDVIEVKSVRSRYLGDGFGYVRISQFMEKTFDDLKAAIDRLNAQAPGGHLRGLVLDLRNNPGGLLTQAIKVSDLFLNEGVIVYTDGRVEGQKQKFFAHARDTEPAYPLIVLVNGGSASASEIVAGAFQDAGRDLILGTQTFGKGSVQTITPLENNGAITLTTALYYTKSGRSIQVTGVKPDIELDNPVELNADKNPDSKGEGTAAPRSLLREGDLPGAITNPNGAEDETGLKKINKTPTIRGDLTQMNPEKENLDEWLKRDLQLQRALELLKTFNIFKGPKEVAAAAVAAGKK
ncbi:MAG: S41 family peptidase [Deltaproteobacteria bacterium]|nr:S41 family peptidase [Deltaproteobacteria bacterium]